jgi:ABC-2 type transport system ATP-binding protein
MEPCLELHGLRRSFGQLVAVDGLSFSVPAGRLFGFVGRNGAGKTTTMRIICGLLAPDRGSVSWRGAPIDGRVRERIGYMPEERGLYPKMRLADQLEYFAVLHSASHRRGRAAALSWLERLGLGERVFARVEALSHGNQQRVQLAAALVHQPDVLILDEPFAGLDPIATDVMARRAAC